MCPGIRLGANVPRESLKEPGRVLWNTFFFICFCLKRKHPIEYQRGYLYCLFQLPIEQSFCFVFPSALTFGFSNSNTLLHPFEPWILLLVAQQPAATLLALRIVKAGMTSFGTDYIFKNLHFFGINFQGGHIFSFN